MLNTTVGQLLINETLPESLRDYNRTLDKKGTHALLEQVAREYPEKYRDISFKLSQLGQRAAQDQGGLSFGLRHLKRSRAANEVRDRINSRLSEVLADDSLTDKQRSEYVIRTVGRESEAQQKAVYAEAVKDRNPIGLQILSGSRGNAMNLASLLASDMLYTDHRDEVIPIPVLRSYAEGLSPAEYWAGTYGARRGIISTKFATQEAGHLSKQLNQTAHRLVVTGEDEEVDPTAPMRGLIVDTDDMDNEGALLAKDTGPYPRNTLLTPKILKQLSQAGNQRILVRSPVVGGSADGGVYARDVGVRETGKLPGRGEQVGLQAAQALSEPISQGQLNAKHSGGVAGQEKAVGGFKYLDQLIQIPQKMVGGAAHATLDGTVQRVEEAAAGGQHVTIDGKSHYVGAGFTVRVKKGDVVEAGDMISDGIPNPSIITEHKGVGEGRRYFVNEFRTAMRNSNMGHNRRNIELLARGLINHVKLTEETDTNVPDDIVPYSTLEHTYKPRAGYEQLTPKKALGQYLERPVLHYTIGTKVRPSMLRDFDEFGVTELPVHKQAPPFVPHMVRGMYQLQHDPDWMTQMYGAGLKKSLLTSTARGATSEERGTSFVPSLASGLDFGAVEDRAVVKPKPAYELPNPSILPSGLIDAVLPFDPEKQAFSRDPLTSALGGAAIGGGLGGLHGFIDPGEDEKGRQRSQLKAMLMRGVGGAALGGAAGGLGSMAYNAVSPEGTPTETTTATTAGPAAGQSSAGNSTLPWLDKALQTLGISTMGNQVIRDGRSRQSVIVNTLAKIPGVRQAAKGSANIYEKGLKRFGLSGLTPSATVPTGYLRNLAAIGKGNVALLGLEGALTGVDIYNKGWRATGYETQADWDRIWRGDHGWWTLPTLAGQVFSPIRNAQSILVQGEDIGRWAAGLPR